jgi:protein-L-isoaspartate(D-aspartate) O-methyltransferase
MTALFVKNYIKLLIICFLVFYPKTSFCKKTYEEKRKSMVQWQIKDRGIKDKAVLSAMSTVPRHLFVSKLYRSASYSDRPLPIGFGQTISQPYIVALMTEYLKLNKDDKVLEVGTGSGYQAAILSQIADSVYTIEIVEKLYKRTDEMLKTSGYEKIHTKCADGYFGWEEFAPYDAIIVTCAAEFVPPPLIAQLKIGGKMCIPVGPLFSIQNLLLITKKSETRIETKVITSVRFVPLIRK